MSKVLSALAILAGGAASVFQLLVAFNVNLSPDQQTAMGAVVGLALLVLGVWFHPSIPGGAQKLEPKP